MRDEGRELERGAVRWIERAGDRSGADRRASRPRARGWDGRLFVLLVGLGLVVLGPIDVASAVTRPPAEEIAGGAAVEEPSLCPVDLELATVEIERVAERIARARTVAEARTIATADSRALRGVLERAAFFEPRGGSLHVAMAEIDDFHVAIAQANSRHAVSETFTRFAEPPRVDAQCDYTGPEMLAIVLGLILGIIPGLILLVLLC